VWPDRAAQPDATDAVPSNPQPPYRWADGSSPGSIESLQWLPERREFLVRSDRGGRFVLVEQFFPGWRAAIDGKPVTIERWDGAFQSVEVPPGQHHLSFEFRSTGLRLGALMSAISLAAFVFLVLRSSRRGKI